MSTGEIYDVDVVAYSRTIRGIIVVSIDIHIRSLSLHHLHDIGEQIVRDASRTLTDES